MTRLVEHRIGLEGETRLCAEFSDEHAADKFFDQLHRLSHDVDLVNIKKEACTPYLLSIRRISCLLSSASFNPNAYPCRRFRST